MSDILSLAYPWIKGLHIMSVISWMAALFYLPRLMVHHTERAGLSGETHEIFAMMASYTKGKTVKNIQLMSIF